MRDYEIIPPTEALLAWYDSCRRHMPWREDPQPYHVWLSEIMLQQTRVEAVMDYYARFLDTLPTVKDLAEAEEDTYLKLWQGLGYYNRVRNFHKAAVLIMEQYGGEIPSDPLLLEKLPGIGHYTAGAIASIAFQKKAASVDGNLLRVYARLNNWASPINTQEAKDIAEEYYLSFMPENRPGDFNQALMDLGATVCLPNGRPHCDACPWRDYCKAYEANTMEDLPILPPKAKRPHEKKTVLLLHDKEAVLLNKRPEKGLLAGLYEFPNVEGHLTKAQVEELLAPLKEIGASFSIKKGPTAKHIFSHKEWHMVAYDVLFEDFNFDLNLLHLPEITPFRASRDEIETVYSIPSAYQPFLDFLLGSLLD